MLTNMKVHVLTGTKSEIADSVIGVEGDIQQVIVFVREPPAPPQTGDEIDIFAEMAPYAADAEGVDCSRASIYTRRENE
jgi:hypothetical protein